MADFYTNSLTKSAANVESTYGTAPASFVWYGLTQVFNVNPSNEVNKARTQNSSRETFSLDVLKQMFTGTTSWRVQDMSFFLAAFGTLNTTGSDPFTHTFTTGDTLVSYTLYNEVTGRGASSDIIDLYLGCKTDVFKLTLSEGEYLVAENTVLSNGKTEDVSVEAVTALSIAGFKYANVVGGNISIDSVNVKFNSYEYTRANTLSNEQADLTISEPCPQELVEDLTIGVKLSTDQIHTLINTGAEVPVVLALVRGADSITITHQVVFKDAPASRGTEGPIDVSVSADVRTTTVVGVDSTATYTF